MSNSNRTKLLLDIGTFLAFLITMDPRFSGLAVHEWLSIALAATIVLGFFWIFRHDDHQARIRETRAAISELSRAVGSFRADTGRCPKSLAELARPADAASAYMREIPRDGWGRRFGMICPGRRSPDSADIRSMGPDGTWFGMDEID